MGIIDKPEFNGKMADLKLNTKSYFIFLTLHIWQVLQKLHLLSIERI